jgi:hypothetical protein
MLSSSSSADLSTVPISPSAVETIRKTQRAVEPGGVVLFLAWGKPLTPLGPLRGL